MHYKVREKWLDLKYFFILRKHYFISIGVFLIFMVIIFSVVRPLASQSNEKQNQQKQTLASNKKTKTQTSKLPIIKTDTNLLYPLIRIDLEENEDFLIAEDVVQYDGYFKRIEFLTYVIQKNDTLSYISKKFTTNIDTLISFNDIKGVKSLRIGKIIIVPNIKGTLHKVKKGESLNSIAKQYKKYKVRLNDIVYINEISNNKITPGERLFIPGAKLPKESPLRQLEFVRPVQGRVVSTVGYRRTVFRGAPGGREFHSGLDIKARYGTPVRAAREGKVIFAGWRGGYGNLVIINHGNGLESRYGHLSRIHVKKGARVNRRQLIGKVGSTGLSTGPHLHFEVRKKGKAQKILRRFKGLAGKRGSYWKWN